MLNSVWSKIDSIKLTMRVKLILALSLLIVILSISGIISIFEYMAMRTYVSGLISQNIKSITATRKLYRAASGYHSYLLNAAGKNSTDSLRVMMTGDEFIAECNELKKIVKDEKKAAMADSIIFFHKNYMNAVSELESSLSDKNFDAGRFCSEVLLPDYDNLMEQIDKIDKLEYRQLLKNSVTFERGLYRSIIPVVVALVVGILLTLLLLVLMLIYYVTPIRKMLKGLSDYRALNRKYTYDFDGDDELIELNRGITVLSNENQQLRKRIKDLRDKLGNEY